MIKCKQIYCQNLDLSLRQNKLNKIYTRKTSSSVWGAHYRAWIQGSAPWFSCQYLKSQARTSLILQMLRIKQIDQLWISQVFEESKVLFSHPGDYSKLFLKVSQTKPKFWQIWDLDLNLNLFWISICRASISQQKFSQQKFTELNFSEERNKTLSFLSAYQRISFTDKSVKLLTNNIPWILKIPIFPWIDPLLILSNPLHVQMQQKSRSAQKWRNITPALVSILQNWPKIRGMS